VEGIYLWRGDLSPLGGEAAPDLHLGVSDALCALDLRLLRSRTGINPLATDKSTHHRSAAHGRKSIAMPSISLEKSELSICA
jgi:hypothetical protein